MVFVSSEIKKDPRKRWQLSDELFFSNGACHILAYTFLEKYPDQGFKAVWIRPLMGYLGNHIYVANREITFDYTGFQNRSNFSNFYKKKMRKVFYQWDCEEIELPKDVLISEKKSRKYDGLWLREPKDFFDDPIPRAKEYLIKYNFTK